MNQLEHISHVALHLSKWNSSCSSFHLAAWATDLEGWVFAFQRRVGQEIGSREGPLCVPIGDGGVNKTTARVAGHAMEEGLAWLEWEWGPLAHSVNSKQ